VPGEAIIQLEGLARPTAEDITSLLQQQPPRQTGEWVMSMANQDALAQQAPSLQIFFHCLQRQTPGIAFQATCLQNVIQICHLVEGNPLAIELAAGLSSHYSWGEIADRLQRNLDILSTAQRGRAQRHRSMTTVLEASWQLLAPSEQATLVGLSVFADTFSRMAAVAVTGSTPEVLMALVNKSWVRSKGAGRYELPRLIRLFTAQRLHSMQNEEHQQALQAAHARYYLDYLQEEMAHRQALADASVVGLLAYEAGNLLTACTWVHHHGTAEQRQQCVAILTLLRRCTAAVTPTLAYGVSVVWAASPLLSLVA
jgi:predicted ATPase